MRLSISITSSLPDLRRLEGYFKTSARGPMDSTGGAIVKAIRARIMRSIPPALKPATVRSKKGMRYPRIALYATGMLYNAIHYFRSGELKGRVGIKNIGRPGREDLAWYHTAGLFPVPVRKFFYITDWDKGQFISRIWRNWFRNYAAQLGRFNKKEVVYRG